MIDLHHDDDKYDDGYDNGYHDDDLHDDNDDVHDGDAVTPLESTKYSPDQFTGIELLMINSVTMVHLKNSLASTLPVHHTTQFGFATLSLNNKSLPCSLDVTKTIAEENSYKVKKSHIPTTVSTHSKTVFIVKLL